MAEAAHRRRRRGLVVALYGLATGLCLHVVASDLVFLERTLDQLSQPLAALVAGLDPGPMLAVVTLASLATLVAAGASMASPRTGTGFGLVVVGTVAWILFPYAEVPWARLLGAPGADVYTAPPAAWLLAGGLVALATTEMALCAREHVIDELEGRHLAGADDAEIASIRWTHRFGLAGSLVAAGLVLVLFAGLHPLLGELSGGLDLLWAPALAGLVLGGALWLWA